MVDNNKYDMKFKVILVGDSGVGKTNITKSYITKSFDETSKNTIGLEIAFKHVEKEEHKIQIEIWDTSGQERFKAITNQYYKGANGAFVVYDITSEQTFKNVDNWLEDVRSNADNKNVPIILIGNKSDLAYIRNVQTDKGEDKARINQIPFLETSAHSLENIDKAFDQLIDEMYSKKIRELNPAKSFVNLEIAQDILKIDTPSKNEIEKKKCCQ